MPAKLESQETRKDSCEFSQSRGSRKGTNSHLLRSLVRRWQVGFRWLALSTGTTERVRPIGEVYWKKCHRRRHLLLRNYPPRTQMSSGKRTHSQDFGFGTSESVNEVERSSVPDGLASGSVMLLLGSRIRHAYQQEEDNDY